MRSQDCGTAWEFVIFKAEAVKDGAVLLHWEFEVVTGLANGAYDGWGNKPSGIDAPA